MSAFANTLIYEYIRQNSNKDHGFKATPLTGDVIAAQFCLRIANQS